MVLTIILVATILNACISAFLIFTHYRVLKEVKRLNNDLNNMRDMSYLRFKAQKVFIDFIVCLKKYELMGLQSSLTKLLLEYQKIEDYEHCIIISNAIKQIKNIIDNYQNEQTTKDQTNP